MLIMWIKQCSVPQGVTKPKNAHEKDLVGLIELILPIFMSTKKLYHIRENSFMPISLFNNTN